MMVPATVAGVFLRLDVITPVNLHEGNTVLHEPPTEQTRLPEAGAAVTVHKIRRLIRQIKNFPGRRRSQHGERLGAVFINRLGRAEQVRLVIETVKRLPEPLPISQAVRRQVRRQLQGGNLEAREGIVLETEGIIE